MLRTKEGRKCDRTRCAHTSANEVHKIQKLVNNLQDLAELSDHLTSDDIIGSPEN